MTDPGQRGSGQREIGRIRCGSRSLRLGYTTGTTAALASAAACRYLLTGSVPENVSVLTKKGIRVWADVAASGKNGASVWCGVRKFAGDDPDVTDGILICAEVSLLEAHGNGAIRICGGEGIGIVTKPGLDQPVGEAAINTVPRQMIREAAEEARAEAEREQAIRAAYENGLCIRIFAPEGREIAKRTFNETLGVTGGISILGSTGIEEPQSVTALVKSIELEIHQLAEQGYQELILTPGNYGQAFIAQHLKPRFEAVGRDLPPVVKFSGYLGEALDIVAGEAAPAAPEPLCDPDSGNPVQEGRRGFRRVLLVSHIGKLVKTAGGIMNTHQKNADCRMELLCAHAAIHGASTGLCREIMQCATCDAVLELLDREREGLREEVLGSLLAAIQRYLERRVDGAYEIGAVMFSNQYGWLGQTGAED